MKLEAGKTGAGAFSVQVEDDGRTIANGLKFSTPEVAYEYFKPQADEGRHSAWNVCYHLEDVLK